MRTHRLRVVLLCLFVATAIALCFAATPEPKAIPPRSLAPGEQYTVYKIDLREEIMGIDVPFFVHRSVKAAQAANADAVILDINTPGGRLDLMMQIRDELIVLDMPTYAFVNHQAISAGALLAITMDKIVMSPFSSIGGAQIISAMGQPMGETVEQKIDSILLGQVRSTAKYKGHPVRICEAFVDRDIEIPGLTEKGRVLTMDQEEATTFVDPQTSKTLAAFIATDINDLLQQEGIWPARVLSYQMTWSEKLAKRIMAIRGLLLLVGLGALFIEVRTPGFGVPLAVGIVALALFFWSAYVADLANFLEVGLFILGFTLLALEIFVIPGFGLAGVTGIILIIASLVLAMFKLPPPEIPDIGYNIGMLRRSLQTLILVFVAIVPLLALLVRFLPVVPLFRNLMLSPEAAARDDLMTAATSPVRSLKTEQLDLLGAVGVAITDLRPAGMAVINGRRVDVVTDGEFIDSGKAVRVREIQGNVHFVVPDND